MEEFHRTSEYLDELEQAYRNNPSVKIGMQVAVYLDPYHECFEGYARVIDMQWNYQNGNFDTFVQFDGISVEYCYPSTWLKRVKWRSSELRPVLVLVKGGKNERIRK